jgi:fructokinase
MDCIANNEARGWSVEKLMADDSSWTAFPGGAPANVATALCKLGTSSAFCGCVGQDSDGDALKTLLKQEGVNVGLMQRSTLYPTRRVMVTRSKTGDREFGAFYDHRNAHEFADTLLRYNSTATDDDDSSQFTRDLDAILSSTKWMVSSTLSLAFEESAKSVTNIVDRGLKGGAKLLVDINWRPVFWPNTSESEARKSILELAQRAHIVKLTDDEAEWLFGISAAEALEHPDKVAKEGFPQALGVLVTAGEKGASYSCFGNSAQIEPFDVAVVETTGAGDAFTAGFLHSIIGGAEMDDPESLQDTIRFAAAVGALTCTSEGALAAQPTMDQVESFFIHGEKLWTS